MPSTSGKLFRVKISGHEMINSTSGLIRFKRFFDFKAGQVVYIANSEDIPPRMYSIASGETEGYIEILYKEIPGGKLTPHFRNLSKGDDLLISKPFGSFISTSKQALFIATGTGIAPFISMLRTGNSDNKTLIHGCRTAVDLYYSNYLEKILGSRYLPCLTGENSAGRFKGRVTDFLKQYSDLPPQIKYYLCGSAEMVVDTRQILIDKQIPFQNILSEIYF